MSSLKTLKRVEEVVRDYHPEYGDDWISTHMVKKKLKERGQSTNDKHIRKCLEYLAERGIVEKEQKNDSNFDKNNPYDVYRIIEDEE